MPSLKENLYNSCLKQVQDRIEAAELNIASAKEASANETKSSAGDKYETAREMMQQEINLNQGRLAEARKQLHALTLINPYKKNEQVASGSIVYTTNLTFFISVSGSTLVIEGINYQPISSSAPIARLMWNLRRGDHFLLNGKEVIITDIV